MANCLAMFDWLRGNPGMNLTLSSKEDGSVNVTVYRDQGNDHAYGSSVTFTPLEASGMTDFRFVNELQCLYRDASTAQVQNRKD